MNDERLRREMRSVPVPEGSRERAAAAVTAAGPMHRRRRWRLPLAGGIAMLVGFLLTAPGQATVDWVAETVHLKETEATTWGDQRAQEALLGEGSTPEGGRYRLGAYYADSRICIDLSYPTGQLDAADLDGDGQAVCPAELSKAPAAHTPFGITNRRAGGIVGLGIVGDDVAEARVTFELADGSSGEGMADVYPVAGTADPIEGSTHAIEGAAAVVLFLPEGAGDVAAGSTAAIELLGATGEPIATEPLTWANRMMMIPGEADRDPMPTICDGTSVAEQLCADAASGELGRVEPRLARPLPPDLMAALAARGYTFTPATDGDRTIAGAAYDPFAIGGRFSLPGTNSLSVASLGRLSGPGFDDALVYVVHNFRIEDRPGGGSSSTSSDVGAATDPPPSLSPVAKTRLFDAETLERVGVIHYP